MCERHILVADDDEILLDATATALRMAGYQVDTAADGAQALRMAEQSRPVVIVMDLRMPGLDGSEVARRLAQRGLRIPVILMTASDNGGQWAERMGAAAFLPKPFSTTELVEIVRRLAMDSSSNRAAA